MDDETKIDHIIRLDVGGQLFATYSDTFQRYPDSLLGRMFVQDQHLLQPKKDERDNYFFDRDPEEFKKIMKIYRKGVVDSTLPDDELLFWGFDSNTREPQIVNRDSKLTTGPMTFPTDICIKYTGTTFDVSTPFEVKNNQKQPQGKWLKITNENVTLKITLSGPIDLIIYNLINLRVGLRCNLNIDRTIKTELASLFGKHNDDEKFKSIDSSDFHYYSKSVTFDAKIPFSKLKEGAKLEDEEELFDIKFLLIVTSFETIQKDYLTFELFYN